MTVSILHATLDDVDDRLAEALDLIGYRPQREALFVKPNVPDAGPPGQGLFTEPRVVEALLRLFPGRPVVIGEGSIVGRSALRALERTGYGELARRYGAELVDLEQAERYETEWAFGTLKLPVYLRTHEYVNVAKLKTHIQTGVTLGMKNQKGLLRGADKRRFHREGLDACIRALAEVARPHLTVIDGIVGLEGDGPWRFGRAREANLLLAGTDVVEVDDVGRQVMGFGPDHAPHIPHREALDTVGLPLAEAGTAFAFDYRGYFRYRNVYQHITDSCSGCNWTLYAAFKALKASRWRRLKFLYRGQWRRLDIVMGHGEELAGLPAGHGKVVCVGDCARRYAEEHGLPIARGCPPEPDEVVRLF